MDEIIHFRTRVTREKSGGSSTKTLSGRSGESSEVRTALPYDDARDIVWSKSTGATLITRNRQLSSQIQIELVIYEDGFDLKKMHAALELKKLLIESARFSGDIFHFQQGEGHIPQKGYREVKNSMVFIILSSLETQVYQQLIRMYSGNDIVFLPLFHPIELEYKTGTTLFESRTPTSGYYRKIDEHMRNIKKYLNSSQVSNILLTTEDNMVLKLNHFFKYRYG